MGLSPGRGARLLLPGALAALVALAALAGLIGGCGRRAAAGAAVPAGPAAPAEATATDPAASPAADARPVPARSAQTAAPTADAPPGEAVIARAELNRMLDLGAQRFIARVEVNPHLRKSARGHRFVGWELVSFFAGDPRFAGVDLRPGDVVTRVNGQPIERPAQFMRVWEDLRFARELVVDYLRGGAPRRLRYVIR